MLGKDYVVLKCPKCKRTVLKLIKILPRFARRQYPEGVCRKCKRKIIKDLGAILR